MHVASSSKLVLCRYPRLRESTNHTTAAMTAMTTMAMITLPIVSLCTIASTLAHQRMVVVQHAETQRIGGEWTRLSGTPSPHPADAYKATSCRSR
jgi:hypothetical protein